VSGMASKTATRYARFQREIVIAVWSAKAAESRCVNYGATAVAIVALLCASLVLAEDFKTVNGKEYNVVWAHVK
jgi:hypothetical protein